ncbi:MFS transporter [Streptomyces sp. NPDC006207]
MIQNLSPLRSTPYRNLIAGRVVGTFGNAIAPITLSFALLDVTGSVSSLGLVVGARSLTNLLFLLVGGALADRFSRRLILVGSSLASGATQAAMAFALLLGFTSLPLLMTLSAASGFFSAFAFPASAALVSQTVPPGGLKPAVTLLRLGSNTATVAGASAGGLLVLIFPPAWGLAADALTMCLSGLCFARIRIDTTVVARKPPSSLLAELKQGWAEFISRSWVWVVVLSFCCINAGYAATMQVIGPVAADRTVGRAVWAYVIVAHTGGMFLGAVAGLRLDPKRPLAIGMLSVSALALLPITLAMYPVTVALFAAAIVGGMGLEQLGIFWETSLQRNIPADRLARIYSYDALGSFAAIPLAQVSAGPLVQLVGLNSALLGIGIIIVGASVCAAGNRSVRAVIHTTQRDEPKEILDAPC